MKNKVTEYVNDKVIKNIDNRIIKVLWSTLVPIVKVGMVLFFIWFYCWWLLCTLSNLFGDVIGFVIWLVIPIIIIACNVSYSKTVKCCDNCVYASHDPQMLNYVMCEHVMNESKGWEKRVMVGKDECCHHFANRIEMLRDEDERRMFEESND